MVMKSFFFCASLAVASVFQSGTANAGVAGFDLSLTPTMAPGASDDVAIEGSFPSYGSKRGMLDWNCLRQFHDSQIDSTTEAPANIATKKEKAIKKAIKGAALGYLHAKKVKEKFNKVKESRKSENSKEHAPRGQNYNPPGIKSPGNSRPNSPSMRGSTPGGSRRNSLGTVREE